MIDLNTQYKHLTKKLQWFILVLVLALVLVNYTEQRSSLQIQNGHHVGLLVSGETSDFSSGEQLVLPGKYVVEKELIFSTDPEGWFSLEPESIFELLIRNDTVSLAARNLLKNKVMAAEFKAKAATPTGTFKLIKGASLISLHKDGVLSLFMVEGFSIWPVSTKSALFKVQKKDENWEIQVYQGSVLIRNLSSSWELKAGEALQLMDESAVFPISKESADQAAALVEKIRKSVGSN